MEISHEFRFQDGRIGAAIHIRVTPRSSQNEISGIMSDGTVKIRVRKAPVEDQANQELIKFLSKFLNLPPANVEIVAGHSNRNKLIGIACLNSQIVQSKILEEINNGNE
jgi:uncharacterized protein (TIGR00251 family)